MRHFARQGTGTTKLQFGPDSRKEGSAEAEEGANGSSHSTSVDARARRTRRGPAGRCVPKSYTTAANKLSSGLFGRRMRHGAAEENDHGGAAAFEAAMVVQLTAVGRTKIDIAFRCNVSHAQNMHYAVMHVSVYLCATPHPLPGARKQQSTQQGL